jgi:hypothetical protein
MNLYGFVGHDGVDRWDIRGLMPPIIDGGGFPPVPISQLNAIKAPEYCAMLDSLTERLWPFNSEIALPGGTEATNLTKYSAWYKLRFPMISHHVESVFRNELQNALMGRACSGKSISIATLPRIDIMGYATGEGNGPNPARSKTEKDYGDREQTVEEAITVLGRYSILPTDVVMTPLDCGCGKTCYSWNARVSVVDTLGAHPSNVNYNWFMWPVAWVSVGPQRSAVIAQWNLSGGFCCSSAQSKGK